MFAKEFAVLTMGRQM